MIWPAIRLVPDGPVVYCDACVSLRWKLVTNLDEFEIIPTCHVSPLHIATQEKYRKMPRLSGVHHMPTGDAQSVLSFQADKGFPGVPESTLRKFSKLMEVPEVETEDDSKMDMIVALIKKLLPHKKVLDVNRSLSEAFHAENPEADVPWGSDADLIYDVVTNQESKDINEYFESVGKTSHKKQEHIEHRDKLVPKTFAYAAGTRPKT
eukprot:6934248-Pyramimonas_sp.AAC.1